MLLYVLFMKKTEFINSVLAKIVFIIIIICIFTFVFSMILNASNIKKYFKSTELRNTVN